MPEGLRLLGDQLGIPVNSAEYGVSPIGQRLAALMLRPVMPAQELGSLAAMLARLKTLPAINLVAELLSGPGESPVLPRIQVSPQDGLVFYTRVHYFFQDGTERPTSDNYFGRGGELPLLPQLGPGGWRLVVRRAGVGPSGFVRLEKAFDTYATEPPAKKPPEPTKPKPIPPTISAASEQTNQGIMIRVTGSGFLADQPANASGIAVRLVDAVRFQDYRRYFIRSDASGRINDLAGPVITANLQPNALGKTQVAVSATDSRTDPDSVPAGGPLWSNTVTLSF